MTIQITTARTMTALGTPAIIGVISEESDSRSFSWFKLTEKSKRWYGLCCHVLLCTSREKARMDFVVMFYYVPHGKKLVWTLLSCSTMYLTRKSSYGLCCHVLLCTSLLILPGAEALLIARPLVMKETTRSPPPPPPPSAFLS